MLRVKIIFLLLGDLSKKNTSEKRTTSQGSGSKNVKGSFIFSVQPPISGLICRAVQKEVREKSLLYLSHWVLPFLSGQNGGRFSSHPHGRQPKSLHWDLWQSRDSFSSWLKQWGLTCVRVKVTGCTGEAAQWVLGFGRRETERLLVLDEYHSSSAQAVVSVTDGGSEVSNSRKRIKWM